MCVIVLWPRSNYRALVVIVILVSDVPIKPVVQLDRESRFGRLKTHRIRRDQRSRTTGGICHAVSLTGVFVNAIGGKERSARRDTPDSFYEEEVVPDVVQT